MAVRYSRTNVTQLLLEHGAVIDPPLSNYPYDKPPLQSAARNGNPNLVRRLIEAGANVNASIHGATALHAIQSSTAGCIPLLLEAGADVDYGQMGEFTILDRAYLNKNDVYQMILPMSRKAKTSLTLSGILSAANFSS